MAESNSLSKQQKKRQKRAAKSLLTKINQDKEKVIEPTQDPLTILKDKLAEAKRNNDLELAKKLRQDIWVLQDTSAGHKPCLSKEEVNTSLNRITSSYENTKEIKEDNVEVKSTLNPTEKRLKNLNKKLQQIEALKGRLINGEKLELTQVAKLDTEADIREEIDEINNALFCAATK